MNDQIHPLLAELRALRLAKGETQAAAARRVNTHPVVLGSYERGDRSPSVETFDALLRAGYGRRLAIVPIDHDDTPTPATTV